MDSVVYVHPALRHPPVFQGHLPKLQMLQAEADLCPVGFRVQGFRALRIIGMRAEGLGVPGFEHVVLHSFNS